LANAQWILYENAWAVGTAPPSKIAVIADHTTTITSITPWGPFTQTETGKYWRSSRGQIRADDEYGHSWVVDLAVWPRKTSLIDHQLKVINQRQYGTSQLKVSRSSASQGGTVALRSNSVNRRSELDPIVWIKDDFETYQKPLGQQTRHEIYEGFDVIIYPFVESKDDGLSELWVADQLKMVLKEIHVVDDVIFEHRFHNIQLKEPEKSLFTLPKGFPVHRER
jgi:hypothetical protein